MEADDLTSLLSGQDPATEEVLGSARNRVRVHGFDLIFAAPKDHWGWYFCAEQREPLLPHPDGVSICGRNAELATDGHERLLFGQALMGMAVDEVRRTRSTRERNRAFSEAITIPCDRWARRNPENYESNRPVTSHSPKWRMPTLS